MKVQVNIILRETNEKVGSFVTASKNIYKAFYHNTYKATGGKYDPTDCRFTLSDVC
jgi:hypothetical protein